MAEQPRWICRQSNASSGRDPSVSIPRRPGEKYDAPARERVEARLDRGGGDEADWDSDATKFIRSPAGAAGGCLNGNWVGVRPLGRGGFGMAGLWEKRDQDGTVVDKIVIKQTRGGDRNDWQHKVPREVKMMKLMNKTHSRGVVRLRAYRRYTHAKVHRLYLRYCPHGDLRRLIERYKRFRRHLPEGFIWEVFYYLLDAAEAMANARKNSKSKGDFQIVHRDIKPDNIFLGDEDKTRSGVPFYPTAKLGDWGLAKKCKVNVRRARNPSDHLGVGTRGWQAPEQIPTFFEVRQSYQKRAFKLYGHTNIWAIGAVMYEMMTFKRVDKIWLRDNTDFRQGINEFSTVHRPRYSPELMQTVRDCLRPYPQDRPSATKLLVQIEEIRKGMHRHLTSDVNDTPTGRPTPYKDQGLFYRGNEINRMEPGTERLNPDEFEKPPDVPEDRFREPKVSPVKFPSFSDANYPPKPRGKKHKDMGQSGHSHDNSDEEEGERIELKKIWNRWHKRENNGVNLKAWNVRPGHENTDREDSGDADEIRLSSETAKNRGGGGKKKPMLKLNPPKKNVPPRQKAPRRARRESSSDDEDDSDASSSDSDKTPSWASTVSSEENYPEEAELSSLAGHGPETHDEEEEESDHNPRPEDSRPPNPRNEPRTPSYSSLTNLSSSNHDSEAPDEPPAPNAPIPGPANEDSTPDAFANPNPNASTSNSNPTTQSQPQNSDSDFTYEPSSPLPPRPPRNQARNIPTPQGPDRRNPDRAARPNGGVINAAIGKTGGRRPGRKSSWGEKSFVPGRGKGGRGGGSGRGRGRGRGRGKR